MMLMLLAAAQIDRFGVAVLDMLTDARIGYRADERFPACVTKKMLTYGLILILLAGHMTQVAVWATVFVMVGEFREFGVAFYHSAVNYTTLGYGDIVMSPRWRLLGPQEAVSGTLAFGWSTAAIVTVVIRLVRRRQRAQATSKRHAA